MMLGSKRKRLDICNAKETARLTAGRAIYPPANQIVEALLAALSAASDCNARCHGACSLHGGELLVVMAGRMAMVWIPVRGLR